MLYVIALLIPPLAIFLAGRPFVAMITFVIWLPAVIFSFGTAHPLFILLAWILIFQAHADRRSAREMRAWRDD